jgi:hypothetical protein
MPRRYAVKILLAGITAIMLYALPVLAVSEPPVFEKPIKLGEGELGRRLHKRIVFSESSVYVGFAGPDGWSVRVVKSENGGSTWQSRELRPPDAGAPLDPNSLCLAISDDPQGKGKKVVHAAWHELDSSRVIVYYAYLVDLGGGAKWSNPVRLDLGAMSDSVDTGGTNLVVTGNGAIHILQNGRYITAARYDAPFSEPVPLSPFAGVMTYMVGDKDTLYATCVEGSRQLKMSKTRVSDAAWSKPVVVYDAPHGELSNDHSFIVLNPTTYFIAVYSGSAGKGEATLLVTADGGASWAKRSIFTNEIDGDNSFGLAVSSKREISFASESYDERGKSVVKVWRSHDDGITWSNPAVVKGEKLPNISVDSAEKLHVLVMDEAGRRTQNAKVLWMKER